MSEIDEEDEIGAKPDDETSPLDSSGILELLAEELQEPSHPEENHPSDPDERDQGAAQLNEYVLPASALKEKRTLEELADMATGSYKYEAPEEEVTDSPEDYFHHTRKLKALRTD